MNQNQLYKLNCLCHVFSQVTYRCSRGYISISSAKYDEFIKITKFVSPKHFSRNFPFSKQNKLDPSPHRLDSIKHLNWTHKTQVWSLETIHKVWVDLEIVMRIFRKIFLRPPWSIFLITHKPKIICKSNQSLWKANKIIYNFHVYVKSQIKTKMWEKDARTQNRSAGFWSGSASDQDQLLIRISFWSGSASDQDRFWTGSLLNSSASERCFWTVALLNSSRFF